MRFHVDDICMEDSIELTGSHNEIEYGYLCAYAAFVNLTDYKQKIEEFRNSNDVEHSLDDCYINFYPCYNTETKEFYLLSDYVIADKHTEGRVDLTEEELECLKKVFFETYYDNSSGK